MTGEEVEARWRDLVAALRAGGDDDALRRELEELAHDLQAELFGERPAPWGTCAVEANDPRLRLLLDALGTLMLLEPDDGSYPWDRGLILAVVSRHLEAADDYLVAARLFAADAESGKGVLQPEEERSWAQSALYHAAGALARGGHPAAAATLVPRLSPEDREEVEALLGTPS